MTTLSGGERRRVALCRLLLSAPDLLLLDEPTNHLDAESVAWLERFLPSYAGTVVAVTHDRYFLDNVAGWILELDRGRGIPFEGNYSSWLEQKQERLAVEEKTESARQRTLAARARVGADGARARQAKSKARLAAYERCRAETKRHRGSTRSRSPSRPAAPRRSSWSRPNACQGVRRQAAFDDLHVLAPPRRHRRRHRPERRRQDDAVPDARRPGEGRPRHADASARPCELAYVDQSRDALDPDKNGLRGDHRRRRHDRSSASARSTAAPTVASFNFRGADQQKRVGDLSGGERNRVHLAKLLRTGGNLLLLDEPTNDLDVDTLRALEEALSTSRAAPSSSATIAGSSTASPPTCWPSRATAR